MMFPWLPLVPGGGVGFWRPQSIGLKEDTKLCRFSSWALPPSRMVNMDVKYLPCTGIWCNNFVRLPNTFSDSDEWLKICQSRFEVTSVYNMETLVGVGYASGCLLWRAPCRMRYVLPATFFFWDPERQTELFRTLGHFFFSLYTERQRHFHPRSKIFSPSFNP